MGLKSTQYVFIGGSLIAFIFQYTLLAYVVLSIEHKLHHKFEFMTSSVILGTVSLTFNLLHARKGIAAALKINQLYGNFGLFWVLDWAANVILPLLVAVASFLIVALEPSPIEGVLNSVALVFIQEIDDLIPTFLVANANHIIDTYILQHAINESYNLTKDMYGNLKHMHCHSDIEYSDMIVTNMGERGSKPSNYHFFGPFGIQIFGTLPDVQPQCLFKEISWIYQPPFTEGENPKASLCTGKIGYLRLVKLMDNEIIEFESSKLIEGIDRSQFDGSVKGVYIITDFETEDEGDGRACSVAKLRICGSRTKKDFKRAMEYYSLWEISKAAAYLLI